MKTKMMIMFAVFTAIMFTASGAFAAATVLTVNGPDNVVAPGGTATVTITADSGDIAGAAFTITFDDTVFSITEADVTSDFFETFAAQGITETHDTYNKPLVINGVSGTGLLVAAANAQEKGTQGTEVTLFTLNFAVSDVAGEGDYTIGVVPTVLSNTAAGYSESGEEIDLLIGVDGETFPARLSATEAADNVTAGTVTVGDACPLKGDLNCDGNINTTDALQILLYLNEYIDEPQLKTCCDPDLDANGSITTGDALRILLYLNEYVDSL